MKEKIKVAMSVDFLKSFSNIPRTQQAKVSKFINDFKNNPMSSGINYEKIHAVKDKNLRSVRIDQTYRGIVLKPEQGNIYMLLFVGIHDDAYDWAKQRVFNINPHTGALQIIDATSVAIKEKETEEKILGGLFKGIKDKHLLKLGVPKVLLPIVRKIETELDLDKTVKHLPQEAEEALYLLAMGYSYEDAMNELEKSNSEEDVNINDFDKALNNSDTLRRFCIVDDDEALMSLLDAPLDQWRVFLHPSQRKLVNKDKYNGPVRVLGGAGTGKTVVAIHRAKWLAENIPSTSNERILFTTFTKNLADDITSNLKKICSLDLLKRIEVKNIDSWVTNFLKNNKYDYDIRYLSNESLQEYWENAYNTANQDLGLSLDFYKEEWMHVIQAQGITNEKVYLKAKRIGRGVPLNRSARKEVWSVFEEYRAYLNSNNIKEFTDAVRDARALLKAQGNILPYTSIIVDEAQDMSAEVFKLLRQMIPINNEEIKGLPNDIFIVGDAHQRIYEHKVTLSHCGINIRGRGKRLKVNYRTTEEIRDWAVSILKNKEIDDLDGGIDSIKGYKSLTHGNKPIIKNFKSFKKEIDFITTELNKIQVEDLHKICIVARTNDLVNQYEGALKANGFDVYRIKHTDNSNKPGIRLATMHRVKGLEFEKVFIVSVNQDKIPQQITTDDNEKSRQDHELRERALLYVAGTRAKKQLFIASYGAASPFI